MDTREQPERHDIEHDHHDEEAFDDLALRAGAALRRPAPENGVAAILARHRRQRVTMIAAAGGAVVLVAVGAILLGSNRNDDEPLQPVDSLPVTIQPVEPTPTERPVSEDAEGAAENPNFAAFTACDDAVLAKPWRCAMVDVPIDRNDQAAGTIGLRVMGIPHAGLGTPVFMLTGAGDAGLQTYALADLPVMIGGSHDVVTIDMRGTGQSGAVDCPAAQGASATVELYVQAIAECGAQLGEASDQYSAANWAMDLEAVREFMGYDSIILHGQGYGSVIAQAYAARHPERLEAVVLDSGFIVEDPDVFLGVGMPAAMLDTVESNCLTDLGCAADNPDPRSAVESMIEDLATPLTVDGAVVADQASIALLIREHRQSLAVVDAAVAYEEGDAEPLIDLVARFQALGVPDGGDPTLFSVGANAAAWCTDARLPYDAGDPPEVRAAKIDAALDAAGATAFAPWSAQGWSDYWLPDACTGWPEPQAAMPVAPAGSVFPDVPTLVLASELDPMSVYSEALAQRFPGSRLYRVSGTERPVLSLGECIAEFEAEFIETLEPPAGTPCDDR